MAFAVMPLFAFANAGVTVNAAMLATISWRVVLGVFVGFTMSLFIANPAFVNGLLLDSAKLGILVASLVAGVVGWVLLRRCQNAAVN